MEIMIRLFIVGALLCLGGCTHLLPVSAYPLPAPGEDAGKVTFYRTKSWYGANLINIYVGIIDEKDSADDKFSYLSGLKPNDYTQVMIPPGHYVAIASVPTLPIPPVVSDHPNCTRSQPITVEAGKEIFLEIKKSFFCLDIDSVAPAPLDEYQEIPPGNEDDD